MCIQNILGETAENQNMTIKMYYEFVKALEEGTQNNVGYHRL